MIEIKRVENGYVIKNNYKTERVAFSLQEVFEWLLLHFEGKSSNFKGSLYGEVIIKEKEGK